MKADKSFWKGAAAGAAVVGLVWVAVFCGLALLSDDRGSLEPAPGDEGPAPRKAEHSEAAGRPDPGEQLVRSPDRSRELQKRLAEREAELGEARRKLEALESKHKMQAAILEGYRYEKYGEPIAWPEHMPSQYRPEQYQSIVSRALDQGEIGADLLGFECREPPCIAILRSHDQSARMLPITRTEIWRQSYGGSVRSGYAGFIDCGDGRKERIELISPYWDWKVDPKKMGPDYYSNPMRSQTAAEAAREENRAKRLQARWEEITSSWRCQPAP
ncbi:MAG: hypothetical protein JXR96_06870 [Deltaproteobacteria bacterium]|nr:hypothetical protein [Deltaproteobacteria bacterium]